MSLKDKFYDAEITFDAFSKSTVKFSKYQPSLKKTEAKILWGANSSKEIEDSKLFAFQGINLQWFV